jgi:GNAT superfamily N-acetyltransferase
MNFQPLDGRRLAATQQVAATLFPWEREHHTALAATVSPEDHSLFFTAHRLQSVRCWTAHIGNGPVCGLATLYGYRAQPDELWLAWFGLLPDARGFGGGAKFLDWLIAGVRADGRQTLRLWTTDEPEYERAIQLYERRGFVREEQPAVPGEAWRTFVYSLRVNGGLAQPWSAVLDRGELCGRELPVAAAAAA